MINFGNFTSLFDIAINFDTPAKCRAAIAQSRWPDGDVVCPYCGRHRCHLRKDGRYICSGCRRAFSVTVGTVFENTKISLVKWFMAMYLISSHKKGISSCQLSRDIRVTQKTAWFILHKIRTLFAQSDTPALEEEGYAHGVIHHGEGEYSRGGVSTNTIEGFWSHFKRMVFGTYHFASKGYLQTYVDESVYRYNTREWDESARFSDMFGKATGIVTYERVRARKAA